MISEGMRGALVDNKPERQAKSERLVKYIADTLHLHNTYAAGYFFCEALNFVNVVSEDKLKNSSSLTGKLFLSK